MLPITPEDVAAAKAAVFPEEVVAVFNELIAENFANGSATVKQGSIVARLVARGLTVEDINAKGWLNVEDLYRAYGWKVTYDKPAYNESYEARFEFSK